MQRPIYLDYNATTPLDERVVEAMLPYLRNHFGNPSSSHWYGTEAQSAVHQARNQVASLLGTRPEEIVFTGSGSEADNLAIKGVADAYRSRGNHIITNQVEHPAVLESCRYLERHGFEVTYLPVDGHGLVSADDVAEAIRPETILITVMHANNEVGTVQPLAAISEIARAQDIPLHTDAAQSVGKIPTRVDELGVDLLTVAAHKLYGPKGVGALYVRSGLTLEPLIHGAGHEGGRRAGTENVAGMVGLGAACHVAEKTLARETARLQELRDQLHQELRQEIGKAFISTGIQLDGCPIPLTSALPAWTAPPYWPRSLA